MTAYERYRHIDSSHNWRGPNHYHSWHLRGSQQTFNGLVHFLLLMKQAIHNHEYVSLFQSKLHIECEKKHRKRETW